MFAVKYLSIIIPLYNEEDNVFSLHERLCQVLKNYGSSYELIFVDDGSTDSTFSQLCQLALKDPDMQIVKLSRNFGQTAAIAAGVAQSTGSVLVFMDGDLQNDPCDIPRLLAKLEEGYDVVSGWRKHRQDARLMRKLPSWLANKLISKVTGVYLHDYGCTLKAYRREIFQYIRLYGEMHRLIPAYAAAIGASIAEVEVVHHPRYFGKSKYGLSRTFRVILDLVTFKFLSSFSTRPGHAIGIPGLVGMLIACFLFLLIPARNVLLPRSQGKQNALLSVSVHCSLFGIQSIMTGLLAELLIRTYYEVQGKSTYIVKDIVVSESSHEHSSMATEELTF